MDTTEIFELTRLALQLGTVQRATPHPDGTPEDDNDHSICLAWLACSLVQRYYPHSHLDLGLVCQYAVVHDALEVYTGDLVSLTATAKDRAAKRVAERQALDLVKEKFPELTWLHDALEEYLGRVCDEAAFVWLIDKLAPKIVLRLGDPVAHLEKLGITPAQARAFRAWERPRFVGVAARHGFPELTELYDQLCAMVSWADEEEQIGEGS
jgi:5'-deoxynucleotidase YfbR-like HD superfamily hydrolase